ncbi:MAG: DUF805 domain-containing protein [Bdellovibrionota bacterium]
MKTIHFLFGTQDRVARKPYILWGLGLMILKYIVEALVFYIFTKNIFTPLNFFSPLAGSRFPGMDTHTIFWPLMIAWSVPFIWIGVGMTIRRLVDSGSSPWWSLLFFVPVLNLILMLCLCFTPGSKTAWEESVVKVQESGIHSPLKISMAFVVFGLLMSYVSVNYFQFYGSSLFMGTPFVVGLTQGFFLARKGAGARQVAKYISVTFLMIHLCLLIFALEGIFCLAMSLPISLILGILGGVFGQRMALFSNNKLTPTALMVLLPLTPMVEKNYFKAEPTVVMSSIEVNASPEKVWPNVVKFPDLDPTDDFFFRMGIATPLRARIEGTGVGAIRHCEFTTGSFVEPITAWEEPTRLAFDVKEQPAPMKELTFYEVIDAPHLKGFFRSIKGEFRLVRTETGTRLEGRTWYEVEMGPQWYWQQFGEFFIHKIHLRVLNHVKKISEET